MKRTVMAFAAALLIGLGLSLPTVAQAPKEPAATTKAAEPAKKPAAPKAKPKSAEPKAAEAKPKPATPPKKAVAEKLGPNQKLCRSKRPDGTLKTWTCGKDQPCCVSHTFNLYTCGSQLLQCL